MNSCGMDSFFRSLVILLVFLDAAFCAPHRVHDPCAAARISSQELNHQAKAASIEARNGSTDRASFSSSLAFMEAEDKCDPQSLTQDPMPCIGKIFRTLKNYSSAVKRISGFQSCMKAAGKVEPILDRLSKDMSKCVESLGGQNHYLNSVISEEKETQTIDNWQEPLLCRYTLDRLFSFSIHSARVFAVGDPAHHTTSSAQKCM